MKRRTGLILALDETDPRKAQDIAEAAAPHIDAVKINWPLVLSAGPEIITQMAERSEVICDFKIADIPNTVRLIVEAAVARGASAIISHAFTGRDSLEAAVAAAGKAEVYAVTEMSHPGGAMFTAPHARELAMLGVECGVSGFIAPATRPDRIAMVREVAGSLKILSPGAGEQGGSAAAAMEAGADYVIVGRSIYKAQDPAAAAEKVREELSPYV